MLMSSEKRMVFVHDVIMIRLPGILPAIVIDEALDVTDGQGSCG